MSNLTNNQKLIEVGENENEIVVSHRKLKQFKVPQKLSGWIYNNRVHTKRRFSDNASGTVGYIRYLEWFCIKLKCRRKCVLYHGGI